MSYGYGLSGDALADLRELSAESQEDVLDALESLVANPPPDYDNRLLEVEWPTGTPSTRAVVVIRAVWDHPGERLVVIGLRLE